MKFFAFNKVAATVAICCTMQLASQSFGAVLFQDTFDRADGTNIDATLDGITDNTGSSLAADAVYSEPHTAGGARDITGNQLRLAVGPGTSNAYVNHNFINSEILANGSFSVSLDVTDFTQSTDGQGGGFAIGMTQAEADSSGDALNGNTGGPGKFTNIFPADFTDTVSDFWVGIRGDNTLAWGKGAVPLGPDYFITNVGTKTGTISANFYLSSFAAGANVNYEVFFNGASQGTGSFAWSDSNSNYIGIDARDSTQTTLDNFVIATTVPEPSTAVLALFGLAAVTLRKRAS